MLTVLKNPLSDNYKRLKEYILGDVFTWVYLEQSTPDDDVDVDVCHPFKGSTEYNNISFFNHSFLTRPIPTKRYSHSNDHPELLERCTWALDDIFTFNDIKYDCIFRIAANLVFPTTGPQLTYPHVDHPWEHKNLIIYLTDAGGKTICEEEFHDPAEDDVLLMEGRHHLELPKEKRRVVLVATYV